MKQRVRNRVIELAMLMMLGLAAAMVMPRASAGMIATDAVQAPDDERGRVKALLARPEAAQELKKMGIEAADALKRVDAMSDAEVTQLAGRLNALPAGGAVSNEQLLLIIIIVLLVIIII